MASRTILLILVVVVTVACGCNSPEQAETRPEPQPETADQVLRSMIAAYKQAANYSDNGRIRIQYSAGGQLVEDRAPMAVQFERPGRLSLKAYRVTLANDGDEFRARIVDPATADLDNQVVVRPAVERLSLSSLQADAVLYEQLQGELTGFPIQLELLLADDPLAELFADTNAFEFLGDERVDSRDCRRVGVTTPMGQLVFWIDTESSELRRLEYPFPDATIVADFRGAQLNGTIGQNAYSFEIPPDAKQVRHFVLPPQPLPSELFGQRVADFKIDDLAGGTITRTSLAGRFAVLVWFNNHPLCQQSLSSLEPVFQKFKKNGQIAFHAVWAEGSNISDKQLQQLLTSWSVTIPAARDVEAHGWNVFHVPGAPTLVVIDPDSTLHIFEAGPNPNLEKELPLILDRLLAGEDIAADILRKQDEERKQYVQNLTRASGESTTTAIELPE